MDYHEEFDKLLKSNSFNNEKTRKRKAEQHNEVSNLKTINQAISLQATLLKKANEKNDLPNYLTWTVILYYNLVKDFGFDLVHEVVAGRRERMMGIAHNNSYRPETIPTTFYVLLLIGIVLFFKDIDSVQRNQEMIPILQQFLFSGLEENAITAIIYLISKKDLANLQKSKKYVIYKLSGFNEENLLNSVLIYDTFTKKKYQAAIMSYGMLSEIKGLLEPTLPKSDILKDFVRGQEIYSISNTGVKNYLEERLEKLPPVARRSPSMANQPLANQPLANQPLANQRPAKRTKGLKGGGKPKTRKKRTKAKKTLKGRKTKRGASVPMRYVPRSLSEKNKASQRAELKKSRKAYKQSKDKGKSKSKNKYYTRKKMPSFQSKVSPHVIKARKVYGVEKITPSAELAKATKCKKATLRRIEQKGQGAYYSSGSRPNQTAHSWGRARLASAITGGKASAVDLKLLEAGCEKQSKALKLAKKAKGYGQRRVPQVKL